MKKLFLVLFLVLIAFPLNAHADDVWFLNYTTPKATAPVRANVTVILQYTDASISRVVTQKLIPGKNAPFYVSASVDNADVTNDTTLNLQLFFNQSDPAYQLTAGMFGTGLNSGPTTFVEATNQNASAFNFKAEDSSQNTYIMNPMASSAEGFYIRKANKLNPASPTINMNITFTMVGDVAVTDKYGNPIGTYPGRITVHLVAANVPHQ
ncbi:MAG: hypothetical protein ACYDFU_02030 [Nitrospirota bacterium]